MKKLILFASVLLILSFSYCRAQWSDKSFTCDGISRQYRLYLPIGYSGAASYPLVLMLHGLGDNMNNFSAVGMNAVADTAKFIIAVPQALTDPLLSATAWNSGAGMMGLYPNANINDVKFLGALIDTVQKAYAVNKNRVYACGFSMGGYMTERLGCELAGRFAAIASMAGTIGNGLTSCNPGRILPVAHFHGTNDQTVPFVANNSGIDADSLIRFWVKKNSCNPAPVHTALPNTANDGYTVDHYRYSGTNAAAVVELFKVNGADHVWLTPANDISYCVEAWRFFRRYQLPATTGIADANPDPSSLVAVYPNPAQDHIMISTAVKAAQYRVVNLQGQQVLKGIVAGNTRVGLADLSAGIYFLVIDADVASFAKKIVVNR